MGLSTIVMVAALIYTCWPALIYLQCRSLEKPKYTVERKLTPAIEIRKYAPYVVACTKVKGTLRESMNQGFLEIAGYIFGKNTAKKGSGPESISMTAPVRYESSPGPGLRGEVSFVMPSKYGKDNLPIPDSDKVKIKSVEGNIFAVVRFSGASPTGSEMRKKTDELEDVLKQEGYDTAGSPQLHQYHPPFAPNWMRRNEVLVPIRKRGCLNLNLPFRSDGSSDSEDIIMAKVAARDYGTQREQHRQMDAASPDRISGRNLA